MLEFSSALSSRYSAQKIPSSRNSSLLDTVTNGLPERYVQILKQKLESINNLPSPLPEKVREILFCFRAIPLANGKSFEFLFYRPFRICLDAIKLPVHPSKTTHIPFQPPTRHLQVGDRIQSQHYPAPLIWKFDKIVPCLGSFHYMVPLNMRGSPLNIV